MTLTNEMNKWKVLTVAAMALAVVERAHANTSSIASLETPLQTLQASLSGPVALAIGIIAVVITGAMLIFGGEISDFGKRMAYVVLVLGILLSANSLVTTLFTNTSALIF
jgi:type IV secretion system protein VirB2